MEVLREEEVLQLEEELLRRLEEKLTPLVELVLLRILFSKHPVFPPESPMYGCDERPH